MLFKRHQILKTSCEPLEPPLDWYPMINSVTRWRFKTRKYSSLSLGEKEMWVSTSTPRRYTTNKPAKD